MGTRDRAGEYSGKVGEVTRRPASVVPSSAVWVRFKHKHTAFAPDWLERVR